MLQGRERGSKSLADKVNHRPFVGGLRDSLQGAFQVLLKVVVQLPSVLFVVLSHGVILSTYQEASERPNGICDLGLHCRCDTQGPMDAAEIIVREV